MIKKIAPIALLSVVAAVSGCKQKPPPEKARPEVPLRDRVKIGEKVDLGGGAALTPLVIGDPNLPDVKLLSSVCYIYSEEQTGFKQVFCPPG